MELCLEALGSKFRLIFDDVDSEIKTKNELKGTPNENRNDFFRTQSPVPRPTTEEIALEIQPIGHEQRLLHGSMGVETFDFNSHYSQEQLINSN